MAARQYLKKRLSVLDVAILFGVTAVFMAAAVPLVQGAILRQRTAECARKILWATEAFDFYAQMRGGYPLSQDDPHATPGDLKGAFALYQIDWWEKETDLGGHWAWYRNGRCCSVVIAGTRLPEQAMSRLDALLDDGNLDTGLFRRYGPRYHYVIPEAVL
jgi:hypothetical protein